MSGAGLATLGADRTGSLDAGASTAALTETTVTADGVDSSMRLLDERVSRGGAADRESLVPRMRATPTAEPAPLTIETVAPPAPEPAPAPTTTSATSTPTAAPTATRTPTPSATSTTSTPKPTAPAATSAKATPTPTTGAKASAPAAAGGFSAAACADGSAVESGLTADGIRVHRAVCAAFSGVTGWGGLGGSGDYHATGRALDIMIGSNSSLGAQIAAYVRANASALGVSEVIWSQKIWTVQRSSEGWRAMPDRGSPTANHYDHVHVSVYGSSGTS